MLNNVCIQGKITSRGIDKTETSNGLTVAKFSINYSEKYKEDWKNSFFEVTAFGKTAEMIEQYFDAGSAITIEGKLQQEQWEDQEGNKRSKVGIIVNRVHFPIRDKEDSSGNQEPKKSAPKKKEEFAGAPDTGGDVPF